MMPRLPTLVWGACILAASLGLYAVKYRVQTLQKEIAEVTRKLDAERESLHVVSAEWAYLNRPERLQALSEKYLKLKPMRGEQLGDFVSLPYRDEQLLTAASMRND